MPPSTSAPSSSTAGVHSPTCRSRRSRLAMRSASSVAALRVKVSPSTWSGSTWPLATSQTTREAIVSVLPDPAPATTSSGRSGASITDCCSGVGVGVAEGRARSGRRSSASASDHPPLGLDRDSSTAPRRTGTPGRPWRGTATPAMPSAVPVTSSSAQSGSSSPVQRRLHLQRRLGAGRLADLQQGGTGRPAAVLGEGAVLHGGLVGAELAVRARPRRAVGLLDPVLRSTTRSAPEGSRSSRSTRPRSTARPSSTRMSSSTPTRSQPCSRASTK